MEDWFRVSRGFIYGGRFEGRQGTITNSWQYALKNNKVSTSPNLTESVPALVLDEELTRAARPATTTEPKAESGDWNEEKRPGIESRRVSMADLN